MIAAHGNSLRVIYHVLGQAHTEGGHRQDAGS
jgi:bisphosphoglycerate-dependent phosphoglycerate mutase